MMSRKCLSQKACSERLESSSHGRSARDVKHVQGLLSEKYSEFLYMETPYKTR